MDKLSKILGRVGIIVENSPNDVITEINNISEILDVDKKTATILHFVNEDSSWNPQTLDRLEDITTKLPLKEKTLDLKPEKIKQTKDFYLINYLDKHWKETMVKKIIDLTSLDLNFPLSHWLSGTITKMVDDVIRLGLYPNMDDSNVARTTYDDFQTILGDNGTFIYNPVAEWIENLINQTKNQTLS